MKKLDFDLNTAAIGPASTGDLENAKRVMQTHKGVLQASGVVGMWIGARAAEPYIMVAVNPAKGKQLERTIPDSIDGVSVYYIEGTPTLYPIK
jgi:hypothetical protein